MILAPVNDAECLGQLTTIARELASTTLVETVARHLGSREAVVRWIQAKPQADDDGREAIRYIVCDVPQRVRLLADDPNCVERATDALMLLESLERLKVIAPAARALATVDRPARHTGLVERHGEHWDAVDLFPRRNASSRNVGWKDVLQGAHSYVGNRQSPMPPIRPQAPLPPRRTARFGKSLGSIEQSRPLYGNWTDR